MPAIRAGTDPARPGQERITPAVSKLGQRLSVYVPRRDDGSAVTVVIGDTKQALLDVQKAIMGTDLLPGEDQGLLPGPDRIELQPVVHVHDIDSADASKVRP